MRVLPTHDLGVQRRLCGAQRNTPWVAQGPRLESLGYGKALGHEERREVVGWVAQGPRLESLGYGKALGFEERSKVLGWVAQEPRLESLGYGTLTATRSVASAQNDRSERAGGRRAIRST
jgi:hypothetical protein